MNSSCSVHPGIIDLSALGEVSSSRPLAPLTKYRLGGPAEWFVRPQSTQQLADTIARCRQTHVPLRMLGGGANLLIDDDGIDGVVARLDAPCFTGTQWTPDEPSPRDAAQRETPVYVRVGAGVDMAKLTLDSVRRGLTGLECMAGIPGSVGGIIRMNAGGRWGEISTVVQDVSVIDASGRQHTLARDEVGFSYRRTQLHDAVVCGATLRLMPDEPDEVWQRYNEIWSAKKAAQPLAAHSAGCVFKNPPHDSAGRLIDAAGLKARRIGTAEVSEAHANFIVAREGGRARDVLELIGLVQRTVAEKFAVNLDLEIEVWRRGSREGIPA